MTSTVRPAAVAGSFYPAASDELSRTVTRLLDAVQVAAGKYPSLRPPKVLVVPHAGYIYSGATAAQAYALLKPWRNAIDRVVLLGPMTGSRSGRYPSVPLQVRMMWACRSAGNMAPPYNPDKAALYPR